MSAFGGLLLTNRGRNLQSKAQTGIQLQFTRIALGDGELGSTPIADLNALQNQKQSLSISKLKILSGGRAVVGSTLSNQDMVEGFYFREIGVFAQDPDIGEVLYCYANAGALAEYIPPAGGADVIEKSIDVQTLVGNAQNITAIIDNSLLFATTDELLLVESNLQGQIDVLDQNTAAHLAEDAIDAHKAKNISMNDGTDLETVITDLKLDTDNGILSVRDAVVSKGGTVTDGNGDGIPSYPELVSGVESISSGVNGEVIVQTNLLTDVSQNDTIFIHQSYELLTDPIILPNGKGDGITEVETPDGSYVALAGQNSPYVTIYKQENDVLTKLPNPDVLPPGNGLSVAFSPNGDYLAVGTGNPYIIVYKRVGDTFTKLPNPVSLPAGTVWAVAWSPDSTFLAIGNYHATTGPYIKMYTREGDTFTNGGISGGIESIVEDLCFSVDGNYLFASQQQSPYMAWYKFNGTSYIKQANPSLPNDYCHGVSSGGIGNELFVAFVTNATPFIHFYQLNSDGVTLNKRPQPESIPSGQQYTVAMSRDTYYTFSQGNLAGKSYKKVGASTFGSAYSNLSVGAFHVNELNFSPNEERLNLAVTESPFIRSYRLRKNANQSTHILTTVNEGLGYAKESGVIGEVVDVARLWR